MNGLTPSSGFPMSVSFLRLLPAVALAASACAQPSEAPDPLAVPAVPVAASSAAPHAGGAGNPFGDVGYALDAPDAVAELPAALVEISGLAWVSDGRLAAVHDEAGVVYTLDAATGAVVSEDGFHEPADFESVEATPDGLWALRSNGTLYALSADGATEHDTPLKGRCDAEGLAYDAADARLLVACKEDPGDGLGRVRAIYAFDLATETLSEAPVFQIERAAVDGAQNFKPSALAVHPSTGHVYVLSSVRPAVAVLDRAGALVALADLPAGTFPQPEGLAFAPDGTLYVSTEGDGGVARLARYAPVR